MIGISQLNSLKESTTYPFIDITYCLEKLLISDSINFLIDIKEKESYLDILKSYNGMGREKISEFIPYIEKLKSK